MQAASLSLLLRPWPEILDVDVAVLGRFDTDNLHPRHLGAGRVGAVGRHWDQADVAPVVPVGPVIGCDGQQPGIFALRAGVRLQ